MKLQFFIKHITYTKKDPLFFWKYIVIFLFVILLIVLGINAYTFYISTKTKVVEIDIPSRVVVFDKVMFQNALDILQEREQRFTNPGIGVLRNPFKLRKK